MDTIGRDYVDCLRRGCLVVVPAHDGGIGRSRRARELIQIARRVLHHGGTDASLINSEPVRTFGLRWRLVDMAKDRLKSILPELVDTAREGPSGDLSWQYPEVLEVVAALGQHGYAILGGDVMHADHDGRLKYYNGHVYCGNWHVSTMPGESWTEYVARSDAAARRYVEAYVRKNGNEFWFGLSFVDKKEFTVPPQGGR